MAKYYSFGNDGKELVITRPDTPRPWIHYLSNRNYGIYFSQTGGGYSVYQPPFGIRINYFGRDDQPGKYVYLRDNDTKKFWTINWQPVRADYEKYRCVFGSGYVNITSSKNGIEGSLHIYIPLDDPAEIWTIKLKNNTRKKRNLSFFSFVEWILAKGLTSVDNYVWFSKADFLKKENIILAEGNDPNQQGRYYRAFMAGDFPIQSYDCSRKLFLGHYGTLSCPRAVVTGKCSNSSAGNEEYVGVLQGRCNLEAGESKEFHIVIGYLKEKDTANRLIKKYRDRQNIEKEFNKVKKFWGKIIENNVVETPDKNFNRTANIWLKYQVAQASWWSRSGGAGYESGIRGYRDVLQDITGLVTIDPQFTRDLLIEALRHQYRSGHAPRGWMGEGKSFVRHHADSPVWIIFTLTRYLKETGDMDILDEPVGFIDDKKKATVYEHAVMALKHLWKERGKHYLCLIHGGDWNDCLDATGTEGKGESVWLSMAFYRALKQMEELSDYIGDSERAKRFQKQAGEIKSAINKYAWDGKWYLRAFNDDGELIGSSSSKGGRMFLMPQVWAIINKIASPKRQEICFQSVNKMLKTPFGYLWLLPYSGYRPGIGKLTIVRPHKLVYNHPNAFKVIADCVAGRGNEAYQSLVNISSFNPGHPPDISGSEPHIFPSSYTVDRINQYGEGPYGWMTGTAACLLIAVFDRMLGVRAEYNGLRIDPCIPSGWQKCSVRKKFRKAVYHVSIENPQGIEKGVKEIFVDGKKIKGILIKDFSDGKLHQVKVIMGT